MNDSVAECIDPSEADFRDEFCASATVRRVAAMLDLDPSEYGARTSLPRGWQFVLMAAETRRSALRSDGFPGLGVVMPDLGLPRLMLGSRKVVFHRDIPLGAAIQRESAVERVEQKGPASGPMALVTISHLLRMADTGDAVLTESQTYVLLPARDPATQVVNEVMSPAVETEHRKSIVPDDTLLFQYCALGFNSHRIHLDRGHARAIEGFPDLVVNGGLVTLLMTEFLRLDLLAVPVSLSIRHVAPLYSNRPLMLAADAKTGGWTLRAFDHCNRLAAHMEVSVQ